MASVSNLLVVIYLKFTSNHNCPATITIPAVVVIYLKFTSNHNMPRTAPEKVVVVIH